MPEHIRHALQLIGVSGRAQILHVVAASTTPMTTAAIAQDSNISYRSTMLYLQALEEAGLLVASIGPEARHGRTVHWSARHDHITELLVQIFSYLLGEHAQEDSQIEAMLRRFVDES